jgi:hypothetical protein
MTSNGQLVFLADSDFTIQMTQNKYPNVKLFFNLTKISFKTIFNMILIKIR